MVTSTENIKKNLFRKDVFLQLPGRALFGLAMMGLLSMAPSVGSASGSEKEHHELLPGNRVLFGMVQEIRGGQARVVTGEGQARYLPMNVRKEKGLPELKKGDRVEITVNDQNLIVDIHLPGEASLHRVIRGQLAQPLITGHAKAVIRNEDGEEEPYFVRPLARSKAASVPVGANVLFLIDERNQIADVTYDSEAAVAEAQQLWEKKTPLKASFSSVSGRIQKPLETDFISIQTSEGEDQSYKVRPLIQEKLTGLSKGKMVVLFVDDENMVTDVSIPEGEK